MVKSRHKNWSEVSRIRERIQKIQERKEEKKSEFRINNTHLEVFGSACTQRDCKKLRRK
jgi:hypothetical protein